MQDKVNIYQVLDENQKQILVDIQDEVDKEYVLTWPCEWMYDLVKQWQDEEDDAFVERVKEIVKNDP